MSRFAHARFSSLLIALLLALPACSAMAQGWAETYGGTGDDAAYALAPASGGFAAAGYQQGAGGIPDAWFFTAGASGALTALRLFTGPNTDEAFSIVQTQDGGYAIGAGTSSYGAGGMDVLLVKTAANGSVEWKRSYGGPGLDTVRALVQAGDGGFLFAGFTDSFGAGNTDVWIVRTDPAGAVTWQKALGGPGWDYGFAAAAVSGGFVVAGQTYSFGTGGDLWLVRLDDAGAIVWQKTIGGPAADGLFSNALIETSDGGLAVAGYTEGFGAVLSDVWVMKLDGTGSILWQKRLGGGGYDDANGLIETAGGGLLVVGTTESYGAGEGDMWLIQFGPSGAPEWQRTYGGASRDEGWSLLPTGDGSLFVGGLTQSFGAGAGDAIALKVDATGGISGACVTGAATGAPAVSTTASETVTAATAADSSASVADPALTTGAGSATEAPCLPSTTCAVSCSASASPDSGPAPLAVQFGSSATATNCSGPVSYLWDFGDGTTSSQQNPSHSYLLPDLYFWTLTASADTATCVKSGNVSVTEPGCSLTCSATATPESGNAPLLVQFGATAAPSNCSGGVTYSWTFGDGGSSTEQNPSHSYSLPGSYPWALTVSVEGVTCSQAGTITVTGPCTVTCEASAAPTTGEAPLEVAFSASATAANCAGAISYLWDFGDGASSTEEDPTHTFQTAGAYDWTLTATADAVSCSQAGTVTVNPPPCSLDCSASAAPSGGPAPLSVSFSAAASPSNCAGVPSFAWTFGDGETSAEQNPTHAYTAVGAFSWTLTVSVDGETCSRAGTVTVVEPCVLACSAAAAPSAGPAPLAVSFESAVTASHCQSEIVYAWDFGDGAESSEPNPVHIYGVAGTYNWILSAGADGKTCSASGTVSVSPRVPGDCDGNGTVTIGEVQKAINTFLGTQAVACGVDCNGDGVVSIGEVQKVINVFLGVANSC